MAASSSYQAVDAVVSSNFSIYNPSVSRARGSARPTSGPSRASACVANVQSGHDNPEQEPLLGDLRSKKKPFYRPRPLWYVPNVCFVVRVTSQGELGRPTARSLSRSPPMCSEVPRRAALGSVFRNRCSSALLGVNVAAWPVPLPSCNVDI